MEINLELRWKFNDREVHIIEDDLFKLMASIRETGSLQKACKASSLSYRYAWGLLNRWEKHFKTKLILRKRGRGQGSYLTHQGETLLECYQQHNDELRPALMKSEEKIQQSLVHLIRPNAIQTLEIHASHDKCLDVLCDLFNKNDKTNKHLKLKTMGSLRTLEHLLEGRCQIAGFHLAANKKMMSASKTFKPLLQNLDTDLLQICHRTQGLIVQKGNPKKINSAKDLVKNKLQLINRQVNSGSRLLFDCMLGENGINGADIHGYDQVEFTHDAVAAMVASQAADVGFANQAAAERFNLDFIPCVEETYYLAFNSSDSISIRKSLQSFIKSAEFVDARKKLSGYGFKNSGKLISIKTLFNQLGF